MNDVYNKYKHLIECKTLTDSKQYYNIMLNCMKVIIDTKIYDSKSERDNNAKAMFQMFFHRCLAIKNMFDGYGYKQETGNTIIKLRPIVYFPSMLSLIRDLYEAFCAFELIYIYPDSEDKRLIMYNLFLIQGLKERQKNYHSKEYDEQKKQDECAIEKAKKEIKNTELYSKLNNTNKNALDYLMDIRPTYWRVIDENSNDVFKKFKAEEDYVLFGIKIESFEDTYSYLSMFSHPSYISILQFKSAYTNQGDNFVCLAIRYAVVLMSFYIADYCRLFPECNSVLDGLDMDNRFLVEFFDNLFRVRE